MTREKYELAGCPRLPLQVTYRSQAQRCRQLLIAVCSIVAFRGYPYQAGSGLTVTVASSSMATA